MTDASRDIKYMNIKEFRELGFLQEANRLFFHPCGLALSITQNKITGEESLFGVWDYRDDPEGMLFGDGEIDPFKMMRVEQAINSHIQERLRVMGRVVQTPSSVLKPREK
jgi:hypothetical protein